MIGQRPEFILFKEIHTNGQEVYKNELNINNILENSTQVQNKNVSPHNCYDGYYKR